MPELAADADVSRATLLTVQAGIESFTHDLAQQPWRAPVAPPALAAFARTLAQRGADLPTLLKSYRIGQSGLWRHVMVACERELEDPEVRVRALTLAHERLTRWIEALIASQVAMYQDERDRWLRGALAQRADTIHAILRGEDLDVDQTSRTLAYDLRRQQTALALWACDGAGPAHGRLEALAGDLAAALGEARALTLPSGDRGLWAWIATDAPASADVLRAALARAPGGDLRVTAGRPGLGLAGFAHGHREALEAQRVAIAGGSADLLTRYEDVEIVALLSKDPVAMRALITRELGQLGAPDVTTVRLRSTVRVFLACGGNARLAAEALGTHKNTVLYRLRRAEAVLGHPIGERRLALELALTLADAFGDTPD